MTDMLDLGYDPEVVSSLNVDLQRIKEERDIVGEGWPPIGEITYIEEPAPNYVWPSLKSIWPSWPKLPPPQAKPPPATPEPPSETPAPPELPPEPPPVVAAPKVVQKVVRQLKVKKPRRKKRSFESKAFALIRQQWPEFFRPEMGWREQTAYNVGGGCRFEAAGPARKSSGDLTLNQEILYHGGRSDHFDCPYWATEGK